MWFWRGTQSAIFYYASLSPCLEYNHKRKRRKEANRAGKERAELELSQPGIISQPVQFQTNKYWAEEITAGPGPPRGWKGHSMDGKLESHASGKKGNNRAKVANEKKSVFAENAKEVESTSSALLPSGEAAKNQQRPVRPSMEHNQSALDTLRGTLRSSLAPENWNWKRYEREDEPLWGLNDTISRMWERATHPGSLSRAPSEHGRSLSHGRKRAGTTESDQYDFYRARNPEVNEMHPPVVSQLPATRAEVAWMLQPPPSRNVMEGKVRPGTENMVRRPLCLIDSTKEEEERRRDQERRRRNGRGKQKTGKKTGKKTEKRTEKRKEHAIPVVISRDKHSDEEGDGSPADDEDHIPESRQPSGSPSPLHELGDTTSTSKVGPIRQYWQPQRPPLAVIATARTASSLHSFVMPTPSPKLNSRSSSPAPDGMLRKLQSHQGPAEWDYLLELCMPQRPARTRNSLPNRRWQEEW